MLAKVDPKNKLVSNTYKQNTCPRVFAYGACLPYRQILLLWGFAGHSMQADDDGGQRVRSKKWLDPVVK